MWDLQTLLSVEIVAGFVLHVLRAGAFFVALPLFGTQRDSRMLRFILAVSLGAILFWVRPVSVDLGTGSILELGILAVQEVIIGMAVGMACNLLALLLSAAGEIVSHEMGFGMARAIDPTTGRSSTVVSQLFQLMGFLLILQLDMHHDMLRLLDMVYDWIPVGTAPDTESIFTGLKDMVAMTLSYALQYALPVMGVMVLLTATLVILARAVSNINLLEFSFGLRIMLALLSSAFFLTEGAPFLQSAFDNLMEVAVATFRS